MKLGPVGFYLCVDGPSALCFFTRLYFSTMLVTYLTFLNCFWYKLSDEDWSGDKNSSYLMMACIMDGLMS